MEGELADRHRIVRDYEALERVKIDYTVLEGNPVRQTTQYMQGFPNALMVIGNNPKQRISPFEPHVPFLLAKRLYSSILLIPTVSA
jgi:hypothetical protein